jgi:hypothetical protein
MRILKLLTRKPEYLKITRPRMFSVIPRMNQDLRRQGEVVFAISKPAK